MEKLAGEKPKASYNQGKMACTKRILKELESGEKTRKDIRDVLTMEGYRVTQIRSAIKTMFVDGRIIYDTSLHHTKQVIKMK